MLNSNEYHKINNALINATGNSSQNPAKEFLSFLIQNRQFIIKALKWEQVQIAFPKRKLIAKTISGEYKIEQLVFGDLFSGIAKFTCIYHGFGVKKPIILHESMSLDHCKEKAQNHFEDLIKQELVDKLPEDFMLFDENYKEVFDYSINK